MASLEPCPSCARHVRRDQRVCPFCDAALALDALPERRRPTTRLCRSALMGGLAVATVATAGCGPSDPPTDAVSASMDAAAMDADASRDAMPSSDTLDDPNCYGPDTGYGTPPFGWCCNADCCHAPDNWFACPAPPSDGGGAD